jgi:site-specific recombinase XerD
MAEDDLVGRDLGALLVERSGAVVATGDPWEPYRLTDPAGRVVAAVAAYLRDLQAAGRSASTQRSYVMDLLRWFRFLWAVDVAWEQATRLEARDFCLWLALSQKAVRGGEGTRAASNKDRAVGRANPVTGRPTPGRGYAASTLAHSETVLRGFYDFHRDTGAARGSAHGVMINPFPLVRGHHGGRAHAHHNPMEPFAHERVGLYRPKIPRRLPRSIRDEVFNQVFARLGSDRDRALVAFWVSAGVRASELLGTRCGDVDPGQQLITVVRKGSRALQQVPASADAFVWLRLYQCGLDPQVGLGRDDPLWWTRRRPWRQLTYHGARAMFVRANEALGANHTLHDLRHTAAYRMARDPAMPLTDVQWVLGHVHLSTTQLYISPTADDVIASALAHHRRVSSAQPAPTAAGASDAAQMGGAGYRAESLDVLFGGRSTP